MGYASLVILATEDEYRIHFQKMYCWKPLVTHDGISVAFTLRDFAHAFYTSSTGKKKSQFSLTRARRVEWIGVALKDPKNDLTVAPFSEPLHPASHVFAKSGQRLR